MASRKKSKRPSGRKDLREFIANQPLDKDIVEEYDEDYSDGGYDVYESADKDAENIIADLANNDFKENNNDQNKGIQVLRYLAESDEDTANKFMEKLSDKYTEIAKDLGII